MQFGRGASQISHASLRFGFRRLEKDEAGRKDVEERNLGSQEVKEKNQTAKETAKKKYEEKQKTVCLGFSKELLSEFSWLEYSEEEGQMSCAMCKQFPNISDNSSSSFLGNISFHMSNIKGYDHSRRHLRCIEAKTLTYTLFLLCHDFWWQTHFEF